MSVVEPIVTSERVSASSAEIAFTVPADLDYFRGHFPGVPVVPGVVQLKWALAFAQSRLGVAGEFAGMDGIKFNKVMTPGATVTLVLEHRADDGKLRFSFGSGEIRYSSGSLHLRAPPVKVCVVVPVYNHGTPLETTVERLVPFELPIIVVDDGSDEATKRAIDAIARPRAVTVVTLPRNGGKGAAVMAGLRAAAAAGYTHAVQVDADGQHDLGDLPNLLAAARTDPEALICGAPQFDVSVPRSRLYGRRLTSFWVAIETLSRSMPDTMCGFRVYPLATCCALLDSENLGKRMDFDIEIAVRLRWRNVRIVPIPTRVIYPEGGTSNFRLVRDNGLISKLHAKLVLGMLIRLPYLLGRRPA